MDILGAIVRHKVFGKGRIIEFLDNRVTIVFDINKEENKFVYPSAFGAFLTVENESLHTRIDEAKYELIQAELEHCVHLAGGKSFPRQDNH